MAKISELVKTFKLLNDPEAPDWNVKFVGGALIAVVVVAAAGAALWGMQQDGAEPTSAAATTEPGDARTCEATEVAEEMTRLGTTSLPEGHTLQSGCVIG